MKEKIAGNKRTGEITEAFVAEMNRLLEEGDMESIKAVILMLENIGLSLRPLKEGETQFESLQVGGHC